MRGRFAIAMALLMFASAGEAAVKYYSRTALPETKGAASHPWVACAVENATCSPPGPSTGRYGSGSTFVTQSFAGAFGCNNATFGDPTPNVVKACFYMLD